jgi:hypothetical protein
VSQLCVYQKVPNRFRQADPYLTASPGVPQLIVLGMRSLKRVGSRGG